MIESFIVKGLWGRQDYTLNFDPNLNIFIGSNGTGKTTLLKLMWYMISGHIRQALVEIPFKEAEITTKTGLVRLAKRPAFKSDQHPRDKSPIEPGTEVAEVHIKRRDGTNVFSLWPIPLNEMELLLNVEAPSMNFHSLFFPTFRRVEGGFSFSEGNDFIKIIEGFRDFSKRMSHRNHQMIAFADFEDVRGRLNEISSDIRAKLQPHEETFSRFLAKASNGNLPQGFTTALKKEIILIEKIRNDLGRPLALLSQYVDSFFWEKSIGVTDDLKIGSHENVVRIENLSAGEKNLLGFLVYARSFSTGVMFIDEPELTLHIDWQRHLLGILREIAPEIQIIVATHAPAIWSSYPDKEIWLDQQLTVS